MTQKVNVKSLQFTDSVEILYRMNQSKNLNKNEKILNYIFWIIIEKQDTTP